MTDEGNKDAEDPQPPEPEQGDDELTVDDILAAASDDGQAADDAVAVLQATLEERTRDLQRITAEFQNYRKRVERDKARSGELATAAVLQGLLPVLDDLDRARSHGDLNGPFGSVAEQLVNALHKHGLEPFGEKGDPFDPQLHEAVAHMQMPDVDGPTCIDVMRAGYRLGDKLLRPALVAVAEPLDEPAEPAAPEPGADEPETAEAAEASEPEADAVDVAEDTDADAAEAPAAAAEPESEVASEDESDGKGKKRKHKGGKDS
ncbi:nucleotide exchange factor GrpE [Glycomyces harbinensis]|uniref:Protein GrpE n=1 Tax=Glycomyces harbinensis TaxID=58114 RepID=A0A1G6YM43_9ACTN|nr:nucleotide exchange factor GrpE [Glycomyces harbinensis]SDD91584.1 molecular chaperone GrpE [Glycomyces harbinensis]